GTPLVVSADVSDDSKIEKVEFGFDLDGSFDLEESEKPKVVRPPTGPPWRAELPTKDLDPGPRRVICRATDGVKLTTKVWEDVRISEDPAMTAKPKPETGTIEGVVTLGGDPVDKVLDVLMEDLGLVEKTDGKGKFRFEKVPFGPHKLVVEGTVKNYRREGEANVVLSPAQEPAKVEIRLK
ncbi:MAG: hypothetical protein ACYTG0_46165, partial [Planctomycetota bacterium]